MNCGDTLVAWSSRMTVSRTPRSVNDLRGITGVSFLSPPSPGTDLSFSFTGGKSGATPWEAFLTVNNLTNAEPPATYQVVGRAGVAGPNTYLYDTLGRRFTAGVRVNF